MTISRILLMLTAAAVAWGQGAPLPYTKIQFFSNTGQPLASGTACSFTSGTTSPLVTYTDYTLSVPNPQCVTLDSAGRAAIWLDPTKIYRVVLRDSSGVTLWTQDGITAALGGSSALWSQAGSTVYNSSGTRVCIGATTCTTALAVLDVAGTSTGTNGLIRIDDTANNPGLSLYGSGTLLGTYSSNSSGLQLRVGDGTSQMSLAAGNVQVFNAGTSGGSTLTVKASATQGSNYLLQFLSATGSSLAGVDQIGNGIFPGVLVNGTATNALQAPNGGVFGQWLIANDSLFLIEEPEPALSAAGQARIYANSTAHALYASINGGAYAPLGSGGGGGGGTFDTIGTGTNVTATMTLGTGGTLTFSGSGIVNASKINSTTIPTAPAADMVLITTAAGVGAWSGSVLNTTGLTTCPDTGGNHLNYDTSTHIFSCGTSGGTVGSVSFGTITAATNTTSAMVVGTGASMTVSGTGTINATQINGGSPPVSGSVWKSNGTLQPTAAGFADIVAMFSGGSGCSGTNLLAADGTCQAGGGGGGAFLPLAGGTMTGNILGSGLISIGTTVSNSFNIGLFNDYLRAPRHRMAYISGGALLDYFDWEAGPASIHSMVLKNSASTILMTVDDTHTSGAPTNFIFGGTVTANAASIAGNSINSVLSTFTVPFVATNSIVVGGSSSTVNHTLLVTDSNPNGSGITMKYNSGIGGTGTFASTWQAGSSTALDVVGNDQSTHRLIVLQTGQVLINRTSDNGSGALLQVQGGISFTGNIITPAGFGFNGTILCPSGQHVNSLTLSGGIVVGAGCT